MDLDVTDSFAITPTAMAMRCRKITSRRSFRRAGQTSDVNQQALLDRQPLVFIAKQDKEKGTVTLSSTLPAPIAGKQKLRPTTTVTMWMHFPRGRNWWAKCIYLSCGGSKPSNLIGKDKEPLPLNNTYHLFCGVTAIKTVSSSRSKN